MSLPGFYQRSLQTRVTLFTLAIFLASIWSLSFYGSQILRDDMRRLLGEQQFSTVDMMAANITRDINDRLAALDLTARTISADRLRRANDMQSFLEDHPILRQLFNAGIIVHQLDGTVVADSAPAAGRIVQNHSDAKAVTAALRHGQAGISRPVLTHDAGAPMFGMTVPIRDAQDIVIGAMTGMTSLGQPNFLDNLTSRRYGKTGGYLLVAAADRLVVTASDKSRVMESLPGPGVSAELDRFLAGYQGSGTFVNPTGTEVLASARSVGATNWYVAAVLPTAEAFAPIQELQRRLLLASLLLTVLAGGLTHWMLKRQLTPMRAAAAALDKLLVAKAAPVALPVGGHDEIGKLIGGFNHLLEGLAERETLLQQVLDTSSVAIFVVDRTGRITQANQRMAEMFGRSLAELTGAEYVSLVHPDEREAGRQRMLALLASAVPSVDLDRLYWRADHTSFWGHLTGKRCFSAKGEELGLVGVIADVSARVEAERFEQFRSHALELMATGAALPSILDAIVRGVEQLNPAMLCSVALLDAQGRHLVLGAAPSLPDAFNTSIDGEAIGIGVGSCGTAAATGERVIVEDISTHPYWAAYRELASSAGLAACWSQPVNASNGQILGTFAIYHRCINAPNTADLAIIEQAARLASIAIEKNHASETLRASEARFRSLMEDIPSVSVQGYASDGTVVFWNHASERLYGYSAAEALGGNLLDLIIPPTMRDNVRAAVQQSFESGQAIPAGELLQTKDGSTVPVFSSHALVQRYGRPPEMFCLDIDLSERKRAEAALHASEARIRSIFEGTADAMFVSDQQGNYQYVNQAASTLLGYPRERLLSMHLSDVTPPEDLPEILAGFELLKSNGVLRAEFRLVRADGSTVPVDFHATALPDGTLLGSCRDITERKRAEERLQLAANVFAHAREAILITAADGRVIDVNDAFTRITGYSHDEVVGQNPHFLNSGVHGKDHVTLWRDLVDKGYWYGEVWNQRKNGEVYAEMQTISAVRDAQGKVQQYVALFSDITAQKAHQQQLEHIAHFDALTSLPNRVLLADRMHQAMSQATRRGLTLAVAFLDLDGFKAINDKHGHETGDQLLLAMANRMKQSLRDGDTLARIGGDEFVAVLTDLNDAAASEPMLTRLLSAAAQPTHVGDLTLQVSASLGVTFFPQTEDIDADTLLRQADQAMYQAKLGGKNRFHIFDAEQDRSVRGHHESLEHIRRALDEHEFVLYYQPKVNMRTGQVIGAEALIRWQHPEQGLLPPSVFLPVVEDHPLAVDIGEWVISTALAQMQSWQDAGLTISVSVNVGARQLQQENFVDRLRALLAVHPAIASSRLELEVLETSALEDIAGVSRVIETCAAMGVRFALDDFGTGYSSLTYLKRLPASLLKVDQSFVRDMLDDPDDLAILEGVIGLASAFRREVIAEGVETIEHGEMLLQLGCELAQGYGIARPMPAHAVPRWVQTWQPEPSWRDVPLVSRDDLPLLFASVEHRAWVKAMEKYLRNERETPPQLDHQQCHFGSWIRDQGLSSHGTHPSFDAIDGLHRAAHGLATELCALKALRQDDLALHRLDELQALGDDLLKRVKELELPRTP
ncbi:MAG: PAS domain S-box protein [Rhodoferax sp.]|nr:PAS domain S-box protein [Rhodoferax sp.]